MHSPKNVLYNSDEGLECNLSLLADCEDKDINDVYQRDIARMERIVLSKAGLAPFLEDGMSGDNPGFFYFEVFTNVRWSPRRRH